MKHSILFEQNPNPMLIYETDSLKILNVNRSAVAKYGYSKEEFCSLTLEDIRPEKDIPKLHENIEGLEDGINYTNYSRHMSRSGEIFHVHVASQSYPYDGHDARLVSIHDISESIEAKEQFQRSFDELNHHINNSPLGVVKWDSQFRITHWSKRTEDISGYSSEEALGETPFWFNLANENEWPRIKKELAELVEGKREKSQIEVTIYSKSGEVVDVRLHGSVLRDSQGRLISLLSLVEDITEEKELERTIRRQNEIRQFVNVLSHSIEDLENYREAIDTASREICSFLGWSAGHAYELYGETDFKSSDSWYIPEGGEQLESLKKLSAETDFMSGRGFLGKVLEEDRPMWMNDIGRNEGFIRKSPGGESQLDVSTCFAFPVKVNQHISALLEFFHKDNMQPDLEFLDALPTIQNQLGKVLERIKARENLQANEQKYRKLFENANDGIFMMKGSTFIECNKKVEEIFGSPRKEVIGSTPLDFSPEYQPDGELSADKAERYIQKAMEGNPQRFEWEHKRKDGTLIDAEVSLSRLELDDEIYIQAIVRDLTDFYKTQEELRRSEELFRNLFLKDPGAIVMVDTENCVLMANESFEELFGYTEEELKGKDIDKLIVPEDEYDAAPKMPGTDFKNDRVYTERLRKTKSGEIIHVLLGAIPVYLDDEPLAGFGIYVDITERKKAERDLVESLKEKEVLLKEIHHRVKNNLAIISALLELQSFKEEEESVRKALSDSLLRIKTMALVHETLYQTENFSNLEFSNYVEKLVRLNVNAFESKEVEIKVEFDIDDIELNINQAVPSALIINELVSNAMKYAFRGRKKGSIRVSAEQEGKRITFCVDDDGVGLPENFDHRNFDSLGMTLVEQLINQLEGDISFESRDGAHVHFGFEKGKSQGSSSHFLSSGAAG